MYAARLATALLLLPAAVAAQDQGQQGNTIAVNAMATSNASRTARVCASRS